MYQEIVSDMEWRTTGLHGFTVFYGSEMEGGGTWFGTEYAKVLRNRFADRVFKSCLEWCSGPGFIGFDLLDHGICDTLFLMDRYEPAMREIEKTRRFMPANHQSRVRYCHGSSLGDLPPGLAFDLVVGNPPHYLACPGDANYQRLAVDPDWHAHRDFYSNVGQILAPDGVILLQENQAGSINGAREFWDMIHRGGLHITACFTSPSFWHTDGPNQIYYIESRHFSPNSVTRS